MASRVLSASPLRWHAASPLLRPAAANTADFIFSAKPFSNIFREVKILAMSKSGAQTSFILLSRASMAVSASLLQAQLFHDGELPVDRMAAAGLPRDGHARAVSSDFQTLYRKDRKRHDERPAVFRQYDGITVAACLFHWLAPQAQFGTTMTMQPRRRHDAPIYMNSQDDAGKYISLFQVATWHERGELLQSRLHRAPCCLPYLHALRHGATAGRMETSF